MKTLVLRGRVLVVESEGCACFYDETAGIGWTCDACLAGADTGAAPVELAEL